MKVGDRLTLMSKGESLIDPETGLDLGGDDKEIGQLQVSSVKAKFSIARAVGAIQGKIKSGDKVVSNSVPAPLQFASSWSGSSKSESSSSSSSSEESTEEDF